MRYPCGLHAVSMRSIFGLTAALNEKEVPAMLKQRIAAVLAIRHARDRHRILADMDGDS